jgi:predicted permease
METLWLDLRPALRRLARAPGFTVIAVGTLALGIGGATAIFSVADAVILRPLPFPDPDRLVLVWQRDLARNYPVVAVSYRVYEEWRDQNRVFDELAGMPEGNSGWTLTGRGEPVEIDGREVTGNFFAVLGVRPLLGRCLEPADSRVGAARVVALSYGVWRDRFSQDPAIVGQPLVLDRQAYTVVGVMPKEFAYPPNARMWVPIVEGEGWTTQENAGMQWAIGLGRLKRGVSLEQTNREMTGLLGRFYSGVVERYPQLKDVVHPEDYAAVVTPLSDALFGPTRPAILALLGSVLLVLLMACANVAGLLLVQATERSGEMAVRLVLGASPRRLARGLFAESLLLASLGGLAGLLAATLGVPLLVRLSPEEIPRLQDATVDARVLGFALVASLGTALLSGLAPVLLVRKAPLEATLRAGSRSVAAGRSRLRSALVVSEVAIALVLLAAAGLLARSFVDLRRVPLGYETEHVVSVDAYAPEAHYPDARRWRVFYQEVLRRAQAVPGVEYAATVTLRPLMGATIGWDFPSTVEGQSETEARRNPMLNVQDVSADYFRTMGIAVKRGRVFTEGDVEGQPGVVVVSESLARRYWPGQDPIGKRLKLPQWKSPYNDVWMTVVGVVADARYRELRATRLDLYMSYLQGDHRTGSLMVRTRGEPTAVAAAVRGAVWSMDKEKAPPTVMTMASVVSDALAMPRFATRVFGAFALVALLLAALGLYGLLAYWVTGRTREIGVRVALGALPRDVGTLVLREGLGLGVIGIILGVALAGATTRLLESLLYGVSATDVPTFAAVAGLLLGVAVLACGLPLRRALRVDPAVALRHE